MRLDEVAETLGDRVTIEWRSFLLRTEPKTPSREDFERYTQSWGRPAEMEPAAKFSIGWNSDDNPPSSSIPALTAAKVMERVAPESTRAYHHALLAAYFSDNRDISSTEVLTQVAASVGVDQAAFATQFEGDYAELSQVVIDEHNGAIELGVTAVPTVIIGGALAVPGAQSVEDYLRWIENIESRP